MKTARAPVCCVCRKRLRKGASVTMTHWTTYDGLVVVGADVGYATKGPSLYVWEHAKCAKIALPKEAPRPPQYPESR